MKNIEIFLRKGEIPLGFAESPEATVDYEQRIYEYPGSKFYATTDAIIDFIGSYILEAKFSRLTGKILSNLAHGYADQINDDIEYSAHNGILRHGVFLSLNQECFDVLAGDLKNIQFGRLGLKDAQFLGLYEDQNGQYLHWVGTYNHGGVIIPNFHFVIITGNDFSTPLLAETVALALNTLLAGGLIRPEITPGELIPYLR